MLNITKDAKHSFENLLFLDKIRFCDSYPDNIAALNDGDRHHRSPRRQNLRATKKGIYY
jgi:hypothetical protein